MFIIFSPVYESISVVLGWPLEIPSMALFANMICVGNEEHVLFDRIHLSVTGIKCRLAAGQHITKY
jgi:hypothetical protein